MMFGVSKVAETKEVDSVPTAENIPLWKNQQHGQLARIELWPPLSSQGLLICGFWGSLIKPPYKGNKYFLTPLRLCDL